MIRPGLLVLGALMLALMAGCQSTKNTAPKFDARARKAANVTNLTTVEVTNNFNPQWLQAPTNFFTLGPGDRIEVEILGEPSSKTITTVGPDGKIYFYVLPGIDVWGLTLGQAKARLEKALEEVVTAPQVAIHLRMIDSKRVWLLGRVQNAGVYPMGAPMTLLEALSLAGGTLTTSGSGTTEDIADLTHSFVIRQGQILPVNFQKLLKEGDMSQNIYLEPDDFVYLPSSISKDIYVMGAVRSPKAVTRQQGTLVAAIAATGGPVKNAYLSHVAIVRGSLANPSIAVVDYRDIITGRAPDVVLQPRDIVYVPLSPYRALSKYADLIVTTFVRAVAINEGARAANASAAPAGVNIGIVNGP